MRVCTCCKFSINSLLFEMFGYPFMLSATCGWTITYHIFSISANAYSYTYMLYLVPHYPTFITSSNEAICLWCVRIRAWWSNLATHPWQIYLTMRVHRGLHSAFWSAAITQLATYYHLGQALVHIYLRHMSRLAGTNFPAGSVLESASTSLILRHSVVLCPLSMHCGTTKPLLSPLKTFLVAFWGYRHGPQEKPPQGDLFEKSPSGWVVEPLEPLWSWQVAM